MVDSKSVVIRLTNEQREAIKRATGKDITELKVDALEGRITPAFGEFAAEFRKAPYVEDRKAPTLAGDRADLRKAPMVADERKAPLGMGDASENRKAPLDAGSVELRKAPTGGIVDTD